MTDQLKETIKAIAKLEILLKLQNAANSQYNTDIHKFITKFVQENQ
jgi:hypothetical protein